MSKMPRILVVDDEEAMRESLNDWLKEDGYEVGLAAGGQEAIDMVRDDPWEIILLDLKMPGMDGLETLKHLKEVRPEAEILMMTAYATVDTAVQAMKEGAFDYLVKPFDPDEIEILIKKIVKHKELVLENILLRKQLEKRDQFDEIIGKSDAMQRIFEMIRKVAPTDSTVLITGESGTGKELIAQAIHGNSGRCYMPLITVNCGALPESLLESELFGYEKGAFTGAEHTRRGRFEMAHGGTLFLDEIGDISLKTQVDLLRVLQQKELTRLGSEESIKVDVRILAATNRDLERAIAENRFRKDLFYRLNVISIHVPPLRERKEDIPLLARASVRKCCLELNRDEVRIAPSAMKLLVEYDWPGNVRELENVIERALVIGGEREIVAADLPFKGRESMVEKLPKSLRAMEKIHIKRVLEDADWNISRAARDLGIDRQTLYNKIERYGITKG
ncbi:MAG: sigma-54-dependent Fis family transcriptional regulator [Deltaproteobacteria bacterium]|nr:sigma-54-dependent Fis family transcriptional regulator [Deltaproteobacteria bacterium]MBW2047556.1 sigma-54-dependent Fis family transcriptional regulator [Deltaproteobacteria bacterium]MBW2111889.1 sigma-54-dependent Fis family transcriptional regulator [Deltaproteobacteria bacterium]MBW2355005.1 sigma-54-dependent Fis family transcriptional regulator [Deltaproteobacteria bacterium]HDZ91473.1 sigma-54-dependent Fis family transcriptional regulator [Deltaproteobacteria bacterium]